MEPVVRRCSNFMQYHSQAALVSFTNPLAAGSDAGNLSSLADAA